MMCRNKYLKEQLMAKKGQGKGQEGNGGVRVVQRADGPKETNPEGGKIEEMTTQAFKKVVQWMQVSALRERAQGKRVCMGHVRLDP